MNKIFGAWRTFQESFLQYVSAFLLLSLTLLAVLEVIRRYGFGVSFDWQQDAVTFGILSGVFLFFAITQSRRAHLRVTLVLMLLRQSGRWGRLVANLLEVVGLVFGIVFCVYLVYRGLDVIKLMMLQERKTESLRFLLWPFFAIFLAGMGFLAISFAFQLYDGVRVLLGKEELIDKHKIEAEGESLL